MRLFSEEVVPTFTSSDHNIITVEDYNEIFFDVYEFEINGKKVIAEKVSEYKGYPVVDVPVVLEGNKFCAPFILERGEFSVYYNPDNATFVSVAEETEERTILEDDEQKDEVEEILFERRDDLLAEIQEARKSAAQFAEIVKQQKLEQADNEIVRKREELKSELDETRTNIVQEFYSIIEGVKSEIHNFTDQECGKINAYVEARIDKLSKKLVEDIDNKSTTAKDEFINDLNELAANILTTALVKEADQTHKHYSAVFDEKFNTVSTSVTRLVQEKIEALKASTDVEFKAIEKVNLDAILGVKKGLDKALSRIGTVKSQLNESLQEKSTELQERIAEAQKRIESYYDTKLLDLDNKLDGVSAETKLETIKLIEESKASLLETINNIKVDVPNIIIERKNGATQEIDLKKVKKELEQTITTKFTNEVMSLKRMVEMMSGGGSVAQQFANGGTMNGNLTVTGAISASQYLGLPSSGGGTTGAYLPLSGGTLTGNLSVVGAITSVDSIKFNTTSTVAVTSGQLTWNPTDGTVDIGMGFDGVVQQVGLEQYIKVTADGAIRDGSVVWYTGTTGNSTTLKGKMETANANQDPKHLLGVATQDIANGAQGFITTFGIVRSANITGLKPAGETWVEGDRLYASPTINGGWTNVEPSAPNLKMPLAFLLFINNNNNPTNVSMFVRRGNTFRLENLHNVYDTTYTHPDGSLLAYNTALSCWKPSLSASTSVDRLSANYIYSTQINGVSANIQNIATTNLDVAGPLEVVGNTTILGTTNASGKITATGQGSTELLGPNDVITRRNLEEFTFLAPYQPIFDLPTNGGWLSSLSGTAATFIQRPDRLEIRLGQTLAGYAMAYTDYAQIAPLSSTAVTGYSRINWDGTIYMDIVSIGAFGVTTTPFGVYSGVRFLHALGTWRSNAGSNTAGPAAVMAGGAGFLLYGATSATFDSYICRPCGNANAIPISNATNASPIVVTTASTHGASTGDKIEIRGVFGNTAANGFWTITVTGSNTFSLNGSTGNAAYTSGGVWHFAVPVYTGGIIGATHEHTLKVAGGTATYYLNNTSVGSLTGFTTATNGSGALSIILENTPTGGVIGGANYFVKKARMGGIY